MKTKNPLNGGSLVKEDFSNIPVIKFCTMKINSF